MASDKVSKLMNLRVDDALYQQFKEASFEDGRTVSGNVRRLMSQYIKNTTLSDLDSDQEDA